VHQQVSFDPAAIAQSFGPPHTGQRDGSKLTLSIFSTAASSP